MISLDHLNLIEIESLLNSDFNKRYHFLYESGKGCMVVEVPNIGKQKTLVDGLTEDQLRVWLTKHLKVTLEV